MLQLVFMMTDRFFNIFSNYIPITLHCKAIWIVARVVNIKCSSKINNASRTTEKRWSCEQEI